MSEPTACSLPFRLRSRYAKVQSHAEQSRGPVPRQRGFFHIFTAIVLIGVTALQLMIAWQLVHVGLLRMAN